MTVLFMNMEDAANGAMESQDAAKQPAVLSQTPILVPLGDIKRSLREVNFAIEPDAADSSKEEGHDAPGDQEGRAALFGRYLGQVTARISRAWLRPRTAIGSETFSCWVQVDQDLHGKVLEITLKSRNGSPSWQISLVHAIESSSPLPAPPDLKKTCFTERERQEQ
jgi:TonB C terminal